jgi:hypothetical protein
VAKPNNICLIKKSFLLSVMLVFISLFQPCRTQAQSHPSKYRNAEDSLVVVEQQLSRLHYYGGLHLTSDAEMYYLAPSFQAGVEFNLKRRLALSAYIHYFYSTVNNAGNSNPANEIGRYRTFTSAVLIQADAGSGWYKGFFIGIGLAMQQYADKFQGPFGSYDERGTRVIPAIRMGYLFPAGLHAIAVEFNGTGPYSYNDGLTGTVTEIFTQVSLGGRFIF